MTPSEVTVITCTIPKRAEMLAQAKASLFAQTRPPKKHLVYHDLEMAGIQRGMNALYPLVETEWLQWLADDDLLYPHHFEVLEPYMADHDIIHSHCKVEGRPDFLPNGTAEALGYWLPATALIRTSLVKQLGGWPEDLWPEDHHFWVRARDAGARFVTHPEVTWLYRFHGDNWTFK